MQPEEALGNSCPHNSSSALGRQSLTSTGNSVSAVSDIMLLIANSNAASGPFRNCYIRRDSHGDITECYVGTKTIGSNEADGYTGFACDWLHRPRHKSASVVIQRAVTMAPHHGVQDVSAIKAHVLPGVCLTVS